MQKKAVGLELATKTLCCIPKVKKDNRSKLSKRQKKAGVGVVLTKNLCLFPKAKKDNRSETSKKQKKAGGVGVLARTRLNLFTAMFGTGFRREPAFFLFYYKNPKRLPLFFQFQKLL